MPPIRGNLDRRLQLLQAFWLGEQAAFQAPVPSYSDVVYGPTGWEQVTRSPQGLWDPRPEEETEAARVRLNDFYAGHALLSAAGKLPVAVSGVMSSHALEVDLRTGVITSWEVTMNGQPAVQILTTRGIQAFLEWVDFEPDGELTRHQAALGGPHHLRQVTGNDFGNPHIEVSVTTRNVPSLKSDGTPRAGNCDETKITISGIPMEVDPGNDLSYPGITQWHGGSDTILAFWKGITLTYEVTLNWNGYEGLHRMESRFTSKDLLQGPGMDMAFGASVFLREGAFAAGSFELADPGITGWGALPVAVSQADDVPLFSGKTGNRWNGCEDTGNPSWVYDGFTFAREATVSADPSFAIFSFLHKDNANELVLMTKAGDYLCASLRQALSDRWATGDVRSWSSKRSRFWFSVYPRTSASPDVEADGSHKLATMIHSKRWL